MDQKVAADTVTGLSRATSSVDAGPAPTVDELVAVIRAQLQKKIGDLRRLKSGAATRSAYNVSLTKAEKELISFDRVVHETPDGFRLAPVLYTKIDSTQEGKIQYGTGTHNAFLRFLAAEHADELATLGIGPRGIARMAEGHPPVNEFGKPFEANIDHIIERAGCGAIADERAPDPLRGAEAGAFCPVNHFNNLIFLPEAIHALKNKLNSLQQHGLLKPGESKWILMLVPETGPGRSGFVAAPQQGRNAIFYSLRCKGDEAVRRIEIAVAELHDIAGMPNPGNALPQKLAEVKTALSTAFRQVSKPRHDIRPFRSFMESATIDLLRADIEKLPQPEARALRDHIRDLDRKVANRQQGPKP